ncbi:MAG: ATP-dependent Clp protease adaptor ClpS [Treponema sp.]|nr:ATP-dependent Clp protease adaptor ClpS [Treponema sp.]
MSPTSDVVLNQDDSEQIEVPPLYKVVFFNDDYTTKDFVVDVLVSIFHKKESDANILMEKVHSEGSAVVGIYVYDVAATRADTTIKRARATGYPLQVKVAEV